MKFSNLIVTAFVGSSSRNSGIHDTTTTRTTTSFPFRRTGSLQLLPLAVGDLPAVPPVEIVTTAFQSNLFSQSTTTTGSSSTTTSSDANAPILVGIREFLVPSANAAAEAEASLSSTSASATSSSPPTQEEIKLLREAFATFYGLDRDLVKSEDLLNKVITAWQRQAPDEKAGLYRVRGDCYMAMLRPNDAERDYTTAIELLKGPGGDSADPSELPMSLLGRARAIRSLHSASTPQQKVQAAKDYQLSLRLSSREDWDTDAESEADGAARNPYAAWEWGTQLRASGDIAGAAKTHKLAAEAFEDIGDKTRSVISQYDEGIDLAALGKNKEANEVISNAIKSMKQIEGGDVELLQRVVAKEGEARIALASALWDSGSKQEAESSLGTACVRLDVLEADAEKRAASKKAVTVPDHLQFSIDDQAGAGLSCSRFKNEKFLTETLEWPEALQKKVNKLNSLGK